MSEERSDGVLVAALASGDLEALAELYRRHHGAVYRFARQMTGSTTTAEDVTQEVFLGLLRSARHFNPARATLTTYLYVIVRNLVLRQIRRPAADTLVPVEDDPLETSPGPLECVLRDDSIRRVREAVLALPEHYREVVVLCDLHERTYAEAAQIVGCREGTVRSRLHRGRAILASRLENDRPVAHRCRDVRCTV